jgi:hypothetical protein
LDVQDDLFRWFAAAGSAEEELTAEHADGDSGV